LVDVVDGWIVDAVVDTVDVEVDTVDASDALPGWTSAGLALIRDEADPMRKGGKKKVVKDVVN
jgi:hypothetical protein